MLPHVVEDAQVWGCITVFGIWMSDGNQLPPAGETACPTYFAKRLIQQGGAGGFACRSNGHNQWSASKMKSHFSSADLGLPDNPKRQCQRGTVSPAPRPHAETEARARVSQARTRVRLGL